MDEKITGHQLKEFKKNVLEGYKEGDMVYIRYDNVFDAFFIMFVQPATETVVHYINDDIGFLYDPATLEVVGIQIEYFVNKFMGNHQAVFAAWKNPNAKTGSIGDALSMIVERKPIIVREVVKASASVLKKGGVNIPKNIHANSIAAI